MIKTFNKKAFGFYRQCVISHCKGHVHRVFSLLSTISLYGNLYLRVGKLDTEQNNRYEETLSEISKLTGILW